MTRTFWVKDCKAIAINEEFLAAKLVKDGWTILGSLEMPWGETALVAEGDY